MTKEELLNKIDNMYYRETSEVSLIKHLIRGYSEEDPDFRAALDDEIADQIVSMTLDCYDAEGLLDWLAAHDFDLFSDYRYADIIYRSDYESDEDFEENSGVFYNGEIDCLFYNEETGVYVKSW